MAEQSLRRVDNLLTELVELVETARTVPMSSSCVVPREQVLDLLDDLREVLPPEIGEARKVLAARDTMLHDAWTESGKTRDDARSEAESTLTDARERAGRLVHDAEVQAYEIVEQGRSEHAALVSATRVYQEASAAATTLREDAVAYDRQVRTAADEYHERMRADADRYSVERRGGAEAYAIKLMSDSDDYADRTLYELAQVLHRSASTAEQGRVAIAQRRAQHPQPDAGGSDSGAPAPSGAPVAGTGDSATDSAADSGGAAVRSEPVDGVDGDSVERSEQWTTTALSA